MSSTTTSFATFTSSASRPYTLLGVSGNVGSSAVRTLLSSESPAVYIRGVVRSAAKGDEWKSSLSKEFGEEKANRVTYVIGDLDNTDSLTAAFRDSTSVFVLQPPTLPTREFSEAKAYAKSISTAVKNANPPLVVVLSSVGTHINGPIGVITQSQILERELIATLSAASSSTLLTFLRPTLFFDNSRNDIPQVIGGGKFVSFIAPADKKIDYIATKDIGVELANQLVKREETKQPLFIELSGPQQYSQNDFASVYSKLIGREVTPNFIEPSHRAGVLESVGFPAGRTFGFEELFAGFESGLIRYENAPEKGTRRVYTKTTLESIATEFYQQFQAKANAAKSN